MRKSSRGHQTPLQFLNIINSDLLMLKCNMLRYSCPIFFSQGFDTFRADETLCDVVLIPGNSKEAFPVHRVLMASSSDYFKAMFTGESSSLLWLS